MTIKSKVSFVLGAFAACFSAGPAFGTDPVSVDHVYNAASYADITSVGVAPRSLVAIMGRGLAPSTISSTQTPLPSSLVGTQVLIGGIAAPLLYASPSQINAVVPQGLAVGQSVALVVQNGGVSSSPVALTVVSTQVGIFTQDGTGLGRPVVFNVHADGSTSLNTPSNSFDPTHDVALTFFVTGLGVFPNFPPDGSPWVAGTDSGQFALEQGVGVVGPPVIVGLNASPLFGNYAPPWFNFFTKYAGPAPGFAGLDQWNVYIRSFGGPPQTQPEGCAVPVYLEAATSASQQLGISIRSGGGSCVPLQSSGQVLFRWEHEIDYSLRGAAITDHLRVISASEYYYTQENGPTNCDGCYKSGTILPIPVLGDSAAPSPIPLGLLSLTGPTGVNIPIAQVVANSSEYPLSPGTIVPGTFSIAAAATDSLGSAMTSIEIPPPLTFTSIPQPGDTVPVYGLQIAWQPVDPGISITATMILDNRNTFTSNPFFPDSIIRFSASNGRLYATDTAMLVITEKEKNPPSFLFTRGPVFGGYHNWQYTYVIHNLHVASN